MNISTFRGEAIDGNLLAFYQAGGATSDNIMDAAVEYLVAKGCTGARGTHINDYWYEYFRDILGYYGSISSMMRQFWASQTYAFFCVFASDHADIVANQKLATTLSEGRPVDGSSLLREEDEPTVEEGLDTYGPYTNLITYSEDFSNASWASSNSIVTANTFKATATDGYVNKAVSTTEGEYYTVSFKAKVEPGGNLTGYRIRTNNSPDGDNQTIVLTETLATYSVTVLGRIGGGTIGWGFRDTNTSDWAEVTITDFQLTESAYRLPYMPTNTYVEVDGTELVTNGDFVDWDDYAPDGWTAVGTHDSTNYIEDVGRECRLVSDGAVTGINHASVTEIGKTYRYTIDIIEVVSGAIKLQGHSTVYVSLDTVGTYTGTFVADAIYLAIYRSGVTDITFSNISMIEYEAVPTSVPLNYSDADEGYKFQITPDEVGSVYTGPTIGEDLVTNGGFDTDSDWIKETGWTISGGAANQDGTGTGTSGQILQSTSMVIDSCYEVTFDIVAYTSGDIAIKIGSNTTVLLTDLAIGSYTLRELCTGNSYLYFEPRSTFIGSIDNIVVKEVSRNMGMPLLFDALDGAADGSEVFADDFSTDTTASWSSSGLTKTYNSTDECMKGVYTATTGVGFYASVVVSVGTSYEVSFRARGDRAVRFKSIGDNSQLGIEYANPVLATSWQDYRFRITATSTSVRFYLNTGSIGDYYEIDDVSIKEISPAQGEIVIEWTPGFDWDSIDASNQVNLLAWQEAPNIGIYCDRSSDGMTSRVYLRGASNNEHADGSDWEADTTYIIKAIWGDYSGTHSLQIIVYDIAGNLLVDSGRSSFTAETFDPDDFLALHWDSQADPPQSFKSIKVYKEPQSW